MPATDAAELEQGARRFARAAMARPLLSAELERDLAMRWRYDQDERALHTLTSAYVRLVVAMAVRFRHYGLALADLVQEGNVGLMQAAARFEPERGVRFSTYAAWWIRAAMQDFVLRNWSIVRLGSTSAQKSLFFSLRRLRAVLDRDGPDALAQALKTSPGEVASMASRLSGPDRSLNAPLAEDGEGEWQDLLADDRASPEEVVVEAGESVTRTNLLQAGLATLTERERFVLSARRLSEDGETLESLGRRLSISKERVRQIEAHALSKLRRAMGVEA